MLQLYRALQALGGLVYDAVAWVFGRIRASAYAPVSGRYYAFRNNPIDVHEETNGLRWLSVRDLRRSLPGLPRDAALESMCPLWFMKYGDPFELRLEASALEQLLLKSQDPDTIRFLRWLQRTVIFPAKTKAQRCRGSA